MRNRLVYNQLFTKSNEFSLTLRTWFLVSSTDLIGLYQKQQKKKKI